MTILSIPSPSQGVWHLGPLPIRAYALCIIAGVFAAVLIGNRRYVARGGQHGEIYDIALWAVPGGIIGARAYHVATDHDLYIGPGKHFFPDAFEVWHGGLGIWDAIAGGFLGSYLYCRRHGINVVVLADCLAPGLLVAQAIGRFGNYFNQELYGRPTTLPWGLQIDPDKFPSGSTFPAGTLFHPTFLYEAVWNVIGAALIIWLDRRLKLGHGRVFALYVLVYTAGRGWIENLRIDTIELNDVLGLRWGVWMSIVLFAAALVYLVVSARRHPGRESTPYVGERAMETGHAEHVDDDPEGGSHSETLVQDEISPSEN